MPTGIVQSWFEAWGRGLITADQGGDDVFVQCPLKQHHQPCHRRLRRVPGRMELPEDTWQAEDVKVRQSMAEYGRGQHGVSGINM